MWAQWLPADLERWLWAVGVGTARTLPIVTMIPAFGGQNVPQQVRMGLALAMTMLVVPTIMPTVPVNAGVPYWVLLMAREVAVGFTVGYVGSSIFRAAEIAGRLIDTLRGANMAEVISPVSEERASPLGNIMMLLTTVIFLEIDGIGYVSLALARSYEAVPLTLTTSANSLASVARLAVISSAGLLESSLAFAAPAVVALLLADLVLGAIARMAQQIPVYFLGMPIKGMAGIALLLGSLTALQSSIIKAFQGWVGLVERAFAVWR